MAPRCYTYDMKKTNNIRVVAYLDPEVARQLRIMAAEQGIKVTALLRDAVHEYLERVKEGDKE